MTEKETAGALALIATFFPHSFVLQGKAQIGIWHRELEPYEAADVEKAIRLLCRELEKFPSLKDVLDRLDPGGLGAAEAWSQATAYVAEWGSGPVMRGGVLREPPEIEDPVIAQAVRSVGGVRAIKARTLDDEPAMRAHFFRAYDEAKRSQRRGENLAAIAGGERAKHLIQQATKQIGKGMP